MKTFIITEVRTNAKNEIFEVKTKYQFANIEALIRHLKANDNTLWNGECFIEGEGQRTRKQFNAKREEKLHASLPYGETDNLRDD